MQATTKTTAAAQDKSIPLNIAISLTNGGRSLNAIWYLNIPPCQKLILQFLGSEMNFAESFTETIRISRKTLAQFICVSIKTLNTAIQALLETGYIKKINHIDMYECNEASEYGLTEKLFDDYAQFLNERYLQRDISLKAANYKRSIGMIGDSLNGGGGVNFTPGGGVNLNPLFSPSSSPEIPDPQSEEKAEKPCHNDDADLIQASISPMSLGKKSASSLGKRIPSPRKYAMLYAKGLDFLYSKSRNGGYDWELANEEAEKFIRAHGKECAQILKNWALTYLNFHGRVKIEAGMFESLWADFQLVEQLGGG